MHGKRVHISAELRWDKNVCLAFDEDVPGRINASYRYFLIGLGVFCKRASKGSVAELSFFERCARRMLSRFVG